MNELPVMPIRVKYADETTKGVNIDSALETAAGDTSALDERVGDLETAVGDEDSGLVKKVADLETTTQQIDYDADNDETEIHSDLVVEGETKLSNTSFSNDVTIDGDLTVDGITTLDSTVHVNGVIDFTDNVDFTNAAIIGLSVGTKLYRHTLYFEGGTLFSGYLYVITPYSQPLDPNAVSFSMGISDNIIALSICDDDGVLYSGFYYNQSNFNANKFDGTTVTESGVPDFTDTVISL